MLSSLLGCFKKPQINENALLHQRACIESIELDDHIRARTHCELCLEFDSAMPECLNGMGLVALMNNDEENARSFFTKALRQDNDFSQARNNLGVIYFSHGDFAKALEYFDRALEIDPANIDARYNSGLSQFRLGQRMRAQGDDKNSVQHFMQAKEQMRKLLAIEPTYHSGFRDLGLIDLNLYDLSPFVAKKTELINSAKQAFSRCLEVNGEEDGCYEGLAQAFFEEGRYDQSFANYFLCLGFAPNNGACREGIVMAYEKSAQAEGGYKKFADLVAHDKGNPLAHEAFCAALFDRGLDQEAVRECELALRLKPNLCTTHFRLAEYYAGVLDADKAVSHCQSFLTCNNKEKGREIKKCQEVLASARR